MKTYTTINKEECQSINTFERNKYFYGKLLTVDDFQTEQDYFRKKNQLLNQRVEGSGILGGLNVSNIEKVEEGISLQLTEGYALDECGNLIVVEHTKTHTLSHSFTDERLYLYIQYIECDKDRVASISENSTCEESCCYNRILETFKLIITNKPPSSSNIMGILIAVLEKNETAYSSNTSRCQYLLSNQQLAEELSLHTTNTDNPHQVSAEQVNAIKSINHIQHPGKDITLTSDGSINIEADDNTKSINLSVSQTILSELYSDIMEIKSNLDEVLRFLMDKALKYKLKAFSKVLEHFESNNAIEIVKAVQEAIDNRLYMNKDDFLNLMDYLTKLETQLIDDVKENVVKKELELYIVAIEGLKVAMEHKDLFAIAVAQDEVCERAEWLVPQVEKVKVPKIVTLQLHTAINTLAQKGLLVGNITHTVSTKPRNSVLTQNPKANVLVDKGSHVDVSIASKSEKITVPKVVGSNILNAKKEIIDASLTVGSITSKVSNTVRVGTILEQKPLPKTKVEAGTAIDLIVAKAQQKTQVPQLINYKRENAEEILTKYQLKLGTVNSQISRLPAGTILSQTPKAGSWVTPKSSVSIVVATKTKMTTVPSLIGFGEKDALKVKALLDKSNLKIGNVKYAYSSKPKGTILLQDPEAGTKVLRGSAIDITISKKRLVYNPGPVIVTPITPIHIDPTPIEDPTITPDIVVNPVVSSNPVINPFITRDKEIDKE